MLGTLPGSKCSTNGSSSIIISILLLLAEQPSKLSLRCQAVAQMPSDPTPEQDPPTSSTEPRSPSSLTQTLPGLWAAEIWVPLCLLPGPAWGLRCIIPARYLGWHLCNSPAGLQRCLNVPTLFSGAFLLKSLSLKPTPTPTNSMYQDHSLLDIPCMETLTRQITLLSLDSGSQRVAYSLRGWIHRLQLWSLRYPLPFSLSSSCTFTRSLSVSWRLISLQIERRIR